MIFWTLVSMVGVAAYGAVLAWAIDRMIRIPGDE